MAAALKAAAIFGGAAAGGIGLSALAGAAGPAAAASTVAPTVAAGTAAGSSPFSALLNPAVLSAAIGGTTALIGGKLQANANSDAAKIAAASYDKSLDEQRRQYDLSRADTERLYGQQRTDLEPYRNIGTGALASLTHDMGYPTQPADVAAPRTAFQPGTTLASLSEPQGQRMRAPDGTVRFIPTNQVQAAMQAGGQVI